MALHENRPSLSGGTLPACGASAEMPAGRIASLYIHVPFCAAFCDYCDFYSMAVTRNNDHLVDACVDALLRDIEDQLALFAVTEVPTVYIGGGTPSILGAGRMERLLAGIRAALPAETFPAFPRPMRAVKPPSPVEFTVEANPESADEDFLRACKDGGVNRLSLGLQSFHVPSLHAVHRFGADKPGCLALLEKRLALAARYFPGAFSADLIAGLPFQTEAILVRSIEKLLEYEPAHVSLYSLTVEEGTPLARNIAAGSVPSLPERDAADALWLAGRDALEQAGLAQYEVSSFARPGKESLHNLRYWGMENWLGAGPAASGTLIDEKTGTGECYGVCRGARRAYAADVNAYLALPRPAIASARREELDSPTLMRESLLMGFRRRQGPDAERFRRRFSCAIEECIPKTIERWRRGGKGRAGFFAEEDSLAPSGEGLLFLDAFLRDVFAELDEAAGQDSLR